jgi:crotonobetainyl-CoA:carnitine CoA-transferase CaiB-like acyl-CoA transferase
VQHRVAGTLTLTRSVLGAVGERPRARRAAPTLGEHTREVLATLGMPAGAIDSVAAASPSQT